MDIFWFYFEIYYVFYMYFYFFNYRIFVMFMSYLFIMIYLDLENFFYMIKKFSFINLEEVYDLVVFRCYVI